MNNSVFQSFITLKKSVLVYKPCSLRKKLKYETVPPIRGKGETEVERGRGRLLGIGRWKV